MMQDFFNVTELQEVLAQAKEFDRVGKERIAISEADGRILAEDLTSDMDLPDFSRSTMDGFAVRARSTFGASEANPAYLEIQGAIAMGEKPDFDIDIGQAARIPTGGMMPRGADSVIMIEHTGEIDPHTIEVHRSVAPGQHVVEKGEDYSKGACVLARGDTLRPQETGVLAAFGKMQIEVYRKPIIGIISTGDEIVPIETAPLRGQIRDVNTYTLSSQVRAAGGVPLAYGIVRDAYGALFTASSDALQACDMVLISGGSSVGARDFTLDVLSALPKADILVHGISISPGKPTILARAGGKPFWGLPGHVVSAMIVFEMVVKPFIRHLSGASSLKQKIFRPTAVLSRNVSSVQGRVDYVRVRLFEQDGTLIAEPILGKSGLIHTMVQADGLMEIDLNTEGLDKGTPVRIIPF